MTKEHEAMKQALEALEHSHAKEPMWKTPIKNAIASLRQAIAEAEQVSYSGNGTAGRENMTAPTGFFFQMPKAEKQEPVLWQFKDTEIVSPYDKTGVEGWSPLYTHPPKRERVVFPTVLRKMWSGGEVQAWIDENVNKENT